MRNLGMEEIHRTPFSTQQKQKLEQTYLRSLQRSSQAAPEQLRETPELVVDEGL